MSRKMQLSQLYFPHEINKLKILKKKKKIPTFHPNNIFLLHANHEGIALVDLNNQGPTAIGELF